LVLGSWFLVLGSWFLVGSWLLTVVGSIPKRFFSERKRSRKAEQKIVTCAHHDSAEKSLAGKKLIKRFPF
jgi:hypothetical protein